MNFNNVHRTDIVKLEKKLVSFDTERTVEDSIEKSTFSLKKFIIIIALFTLYFYDSPLTWIVFLYTITIIMFRDLRYWFILPNNTIQIIEQLRKKPTEKSMKINAKFVKKNHLAISFDISEIPLIGVRIDSKSVENTTTTVPIFFWNSKRKKDVHVTIRDNIISLELDGIPRKAELIIFVIPVSYILLAFGLTDDVHMCDLFKRMQFRVIPRTLS